MWINNSYKVCLKASSFARSCFCMETITRFPFVNLSTELCLLIFAYAARPTFAQTDDYDARNPYSSALALCRVSHIVRRAVLPELLRTVLLSEDSNVTAFVHALRMQKAYAEQWNHLHFAYEAHIRRIWIGEIFQPPPVAPHGSLSPNSLSYTSSDSEIDFSLLAPVLLGAQSLALDFSSLFLLHGCLYYAWHSHMDMKVRLGVGRFSPPWSTKTLTLSGEHTPWRPFMNTTEGSAFLASTSRLIFLSPTLIGAPLLPARGLCLDNDNRKESGEYKLPSWTTGVPWASFKSLQAVSMAFPQLSPITSSEDVHIELLTFSAPQLLSYWALQDTGTYTSEDSMEGRVSSIDNDVRITISRSHSRIHFCILCQDWEKAWACGLCN
ncbi:hypothetical protein K503DRAFT_768694 [Rhizopogon vinicolor AM-OR11-026]|uniref:Uncharacterized protein n=1 Tax=Rhizopogon vinicolor AM-OR11-026 TaxID=1314800 RepID=A0A1B7N630_9AGAM|nr:hypothetical protein K503DRAFT_768694 [Rhizopogon vinicolor AM-OR11-026]